MATPIGRAAHRSAPGERIARRRADIGLMITVLTWASAFPAIRVGLAGFAPWSLGLLRLLIASAALGVVAIFVRPGLPARGQWPRIVLAGLVGQTLYQGFLMTGELSVPPGTASLIVAAAPVCSVLAARLLLGEAVGRRWRGFALACAGVALVSIPLGVGGGVAIFAVLAATVCQGLYHVIVKPLAEQLGALPATMWTLWAGAVLALPAAGQLSGDLGHASAASLGAAVFLGVVPSAIGYLSWSDALARTDVARATAALYLVPVVALGLSAVWLGERPSGWSLLGGAITIAGVGWARGRPRSGPAQPSNGQPDSTEACRCSA